MHSEGGGPGEMWMSHCGCPTLCVCKYHDLGCGCPTSWCGCPVDVPHVPLWMSHFSVDVPLFDQKNFFWKKMKKAQKRNIKHTKKRRKKKTKMWVSYFCVDVPVWVSYTHHRLDCGTSTPKCGCPTRPTICGSTSHYPWDIHTTPLWRHRGVS